MQFQSKSQLFKFDKMSLRLLWRNTVYGENDRSKKGRAYRWIQVIDNVLDLRLAVCFILRF